MIRIHQRVTARQQNVGYFRVCADIFDGLTDLLVEFCLRRTNHPLAEAMPAICGADIRGKNKRSLLVLMLNAVYDGIVVLTACIIRAGGVQLGRRRNTHPSYRVVWVIRINQR